MAYGSIKRVKKPDWTWRSHFPELSHFMDDLDSQEFTKEIVPQGMEMIRVRYHNDFEGSKSEKSLSKYQKVNT